MSYKPSDHCDIHVGTKLNWVTGECSDCTKEAEVKRKGTEGKRREKRRKVKDVRLALKSDLHNLIHEYTDHAIAESWKGGGDPADIPVLEAQLELARTKLERHIDKVFGDPDA